MRMDNVRPASAKESEHLPIRHEREPFLPLTLATLAAPLLWVLHFALVYLLEGFLCVRVAPAVALIPQAMLVATLVCGGGCAWSLFAGGTWLRKAGVTQLQSGNFLRAVQRVLAGLALVAIVWGGSGALLLSPCAFSY